MRESQIPKKSTGDIAHAAVKAAISAIPIAGAPAAEIFALVVTPPLEKRRDEWIESIGEGLKELAQKVDGFKLGDLAKNEAFITTVTHASQAAIRNHQNEKLEALRNVVLNAALPNPPEQDMQLVFLAYVDTLTTWHLTILKFLDDPKEWGMKHGITYPEWPMGSINTALEYAFPELRGKRETNDVFIRDLYSRGLITTDSLHTTISGVGILASRTTAMGKQFLAFISSPLE
jgi:hypothetical protein